MQSGPAKKDPKKTKTESKEVKKKSIKSIDKSTSGSLEKTKKSSVEIKKSLSLPSKSESLISETRPSKEDNDKKKKSNPTILQTKSKADNKIEEKKESENLIKKSNSTGFTSTSGSLEKTKKASVNKIKKSLSQSSKSESVILKTESQITDFGPSKESAEDVKRTKEEIEDGKKSIEKSSSECFSLKSGSILSEPAIKKTSSIDKNMKNEEKNLKISIKSSMPKSTGIKFENPANQNLIKDETYYENLRKKYIELLREGETISISFEFKETGSLSKPDTLNRIKCSNVFYANHIGWFIQLQLVEDAIENETYLHVYLYSIDCEPAHPDIDWSVYVEAHLTLTSMTNESKTILIKKEYKKYTGFGEDHFMKILRDASNPKDDFYRIKGILKVEKPFIEFIEFNEGSDQQILEEFVEKQLISERPSNFERF